MLGPLPTCKTSIVVIATLFYLFTVKNKGNHKRGGAAGRMCYEHYMVAQHSLIIYHECSKIYLRPLHQICGISTHHIQLASLRTRCVLDCSIGKTLLALLLMVLVHGMLHKLILPSLLSPGRRWKCPQIPNSYTAIVTFD